MKIYLLAGKAGSGKDLMGRYMKTQYDFQGHNACILHITTPLYEYAKNYFSWNGNMAEKPREFLQEMGIEVIQKKLGKKYFLLDRLTEDIDILKNFFDVFIIADGRLLFEFEELKRRFPGTKIVHVIREDYDNKLTALWMIDRDDSTGYITWDNLGVLVVNCLEGMKYSKEKGENE